MHRNWLTSTTALALVLNAAAPLPSSAYQAPSPRAASQPRAELRLAQNDASTAADELLNEVLDDPATPGSAEETGAAPLDSAPTEAETVPDDSAAAAQAEVEKEAAQAEAEAGAAAEAEAARQAAEAAEAEKAAADAAAAQTEADAAAQAEADAAAQAEADAAAQAEQDAAAQTEADAAAQAEEDAAAQTEADAAAQAEQDAAAQTEADAEAQAEADAAAKSEADAAAAEAVGATQTGEDQSEENAAPDAAGDVATQDPAENAAPDVLPEVSAADQATSAELADDASSAAAAASGEGKVVGTEEITVTEEDARASNEEFSTSASGQDAPVIQPGVKKKDNDLLKTLGIAAAAGLGGYAIGRMLDGGGKVVSNTGDRVVVQEPSGGYRIIKDDDTLLRRPGSDVQTQTYSDGSTRSAVSEADGSQTVTIRAADGRVLRRTRILPDGRDVVLFDDTRSFARVDVTELERAQANRQSRDYDYSTSDVDQLRTALNATNGNLPDRTYSLNQIRRIDAVRHLVPVIALDAINFKTGSAVIEADEAQDLSDLGRAMTAAINDDPGQVFLIEGHTDTVGDASYNLALSDRRAESVALALSEYFDVPPSNMIVQGYGEQDLRIRQQGDIRANRRGAVRNITQLLDGGR